MALAIFDSIALPRIPRTNFSARHTYTGSGNMAELIPVLTKMVLPGDTWNISSELFIRFAPMLTPIMHEVTARVEYFFVPLRLVWDNFGDFMRGKVETELFPKINITNALYRQYPLLDYIGYNRVLQNQDTSQSISSLPFRAYQLIYNSFYRNETLEEEIEIEKGNGSDQANFSKLCTMRLRGWEKDYFTACLPYAQSGDPVELPLVGNASIGLRSDTTDPGQFVLASNHNAPTAGYLTNANSGDLRNFHVIGADGQSLVYNPNGTLTLTGLGSSTIEELRRAYAAQRFKERNAISGDTYQDFIYAHFGVKGSDARFQRPEYLGGFKCPVVISEVLQTSETNETPQGGMAGHAVAASAGHGMRKFRSEEYGYIFAILSVQPKSVYQQGLDRELTKFEPTEFGLPVFSRLGEQAILKQELYNDPSDGHNSETFGYLPRYTEYKTFPSTIHGAFKTTLDDWHLGRIFDSRPSLNGDFVHMQVPEMTRIFNNLNPSDEHIYFQVLHKGSVKRCLTKFSTPTI